MTCLKHGISALLLSSLSFASLANASNGTDARLFGSFYPYLGVDVGSLEFDLTDKRVNMVGVIGGLQLNDYLGVEFHWSQSIDKVDLYLNGDSSNPSVFSDAGVDSYGVGLTFQADLYKRAYLKSLIGVSRIDSDSEYLRDDVGVAKLGFGYQFNPDVAAEMTYNYNFSKYDASHHGVGVQLKYYF